VAEPVDPDSPRIYNADATDVLPLSARLNGALTRTGTTATAVWVYWGTNDGQDVKGDWATNETFGVCSDDVPPARVYSTNLTGLADDTTYYYRYYATNEYGESWGDPSVAFPTLPTTPLIDNADGATDITLHSATLNGTLTHAGSAPARVWVFWGTNDAEEAKGSWDHSRDLGVSSGPVPQDYSTNVASLAFDTPYYYRYYATNDYGDSWAAPTKSFTTRRPRQGLVRSVNTYSIALGAGVHSVTNALVGSEDISQCVPFMTTAHDATGVASSGSWVADVYFRTSPNSVVIERSHTQGTFCSSVSVVEFDPAEVNVLTGMFSIAGNSATAALPQPVDPEHSAAVSYYKVDNADSFINQILVMTELEANQLAFTRAASTQPADGHWYVFEAVNDGFNVQAGTVYVDWYQSAVALKIDPVTPARTMIIASSASPGWHKNNRDSRRYLVNSTCTDAELTDNRTVTITRGSAPNEFGQGVESSVFAVEFTKDERVQRGTFSHGTDAVPQTATIASVDTNLAMGWNPSVPGLMRNPFGTKGMHYPYCGTLQLVTIGSETEVVGTRKAAIGTPVGNWEVIEWAEFHPDAPAIENAGAIDVTPVTATLTGALTATGGAPTDVWVYWGTNDAEDVKSSWEHSRYLGVIGGPVPRDLSATVAGLAAGADYYYRFYACSGDFDAWAFPSAGFRTSLDRFAYGTSTKITFTGYTKTEALTDFPLLVVLSESLPGFRYSQFVSANGYDLRFTDTTRKNVLNHEVEKWDTNGVSFVWVRVPELTKDGTIWAFWGNAAVADGPAPHTADGSTWRSDYSAVWHLSETSGTHNDSTVNGIGASTNGGVVQGTAGYIAGYDGFDGVDDSLHTDTMALGDRATISFWANPDVGSGELFGRTFSSKAYIKVMLSVNQWTGEIRRKDVSRNVTVTGSIGPVTGKWTHVAYVYNTGNRAELFLDGAIVDTALSAALPFAKLRSFFVGNGFEGRMDEVRVSDTTRSADWIWACWTNQVSGSAFCDYQVNWRGGLLLIVR